VVLGSGGVQPLAGLRVSGTFFFPFFLSFSGLCLRFSGRWSRSLLEASSDKHGKHAQAKMVIH
jgi:amino acid permease